MSYLLGKILICLIIAAVLGAIIGWLLHRCCCNGNEETFEESAVDVAVSETKEQRTPLFVAPAEKDDLTQISGIGPVLQGILHELGITSFKQVSEFTAADIERVQEALPEFPGRILRDDWVGGAKEEYKKKYG